MNRRKLERYLTGFNCAFSEHCANHDEWRRRDVSKGAMIPRHTEI
jgi:hypothetical protein